MMESPRRICRDGNAQAVRARAACMTLEVDVLSSMPSTHAVSLPGLHALNMTIRPCLARTDKSDRRARRNQHALTVAPPWPELLAGSDEVMDMINLKIKHPGHPPANTCSCTPSRWRHGARTPHCRSVLCCCLISALCSPGKHGKLTNWTYNFCHCSLSLLRQAREYRAWSGFHNQDLHVAIAISRWPNSTKTILAHFGAAWEERGAFYQYEALHARCLNDRGQNRWHDTGAHLS